MRRICVNTSKREEMLDITERVLSVIAESGIIEGLCTIYCPHTTAAVAINENYDDSVKRDILMKLQKLYSDPGYSHSEGNSDAHLKSAVIGTDVSIIISGGQAVLGRWQGIFLCEFDGPREREIYVQILG